jgi:hypothetical protein
MLDCELEKMKKRVEKEIHKGRTRHKKERNKKAIRKGMNKREKEVKIH